MQFDMCAADPDPVQTGDISLQWYDQKLPSYPFKVTGSINDDPAQACAPVATMCPFSAEQCVVGWNNAPQCDSCI